MTCRGRYSFAQGEGTDQYVDQYFDRRIDRSEVQRGTDDYGNRSKSQFRRGVREVAQGDEPVIVENHGQPLVAIVPVEHVDRLRELEDEQRSGEWLERMQQLRSLVRARNQDLTDEQAEQLSDEIVRDAVDALFDKGIVRYAE